MKNFERKMIEEKGLEYEMLEFETQGELQIMPIEVVIEFIENTPQKIRAQIQATLSEIDFKNGDIMHYIEFLAKGIAQL